jgi:glycosyltransferase involved in cell wall biosynthesis
MKPTDLDSGRSDAVVWTWIGDSEGEVRAAAAAASRYDTVLIQHEFGIYPGRDGAAILGFVDACPRPVFVVLHTVLEHPSTNQRAIVDALLARANLAIVHTTVARQRLLEVHAVDGSRVAILPHGAQPNIDGPPLVVSERPIVLTWGLLGPGKGIETGIEAIARLRADGFDARYIVAGETHPNVRAREGERYRDELVRLARTLAVDDLVEFIDGYYDWDTLRALVRSATVVLVPYESRDQVTSGVLVEALAAAKPVVATAFPHAVELSCSGAVDVIPHDSPEACAAALSAILTADERRVRMSRAARSEAIRHDWSNVARRLVTLMAEELADAGSMASLAT